MTLDVNQAPARNRHFGAASDRRNAEENFPTSRARRRRRRYLTPLPSAAASTPRRLAAHPRHLVALEGDLERVPVARPVPPGGCVEGGRAVRRRVAERHEHLIARHADANRNAGWLSVTDRVLDLFFDR